MKRLLTYTFIILTLILPVKAQTLEGGVSISNAVPREFFGLWHVIATRVETTNPGMFESSTNEIWNLTRENNVVTLRNMISLAQASVEVTNAGERSFTFVRTTIDGDEKVTETVTLELNGNTFKGTDTMKVQTLSKKSGIKEEKAIYKLVAIKP